MNTVHHETTGLIVTVVSIIALIISLERPGRHGNNTNMRLCAEAVFSIVGMCGILLVVVP